jgi:hypothetical protein
LVTGSWKAAYSAASVPSKYNHYGCDNVSYRKQKDNNTILHPSPDYCVF